MSEDREAFQARLREALLSADHWAWNLPKLPPGYFYVLERDKDGMSYYVPRESPKKIQGARPSMTIIDETMRE